jgi:hypothetical protein
MSNKKLQEESLEKHIVNIVRKEIIDIKEAEIKKIIDKLLPDLDDLISTKIKEHINTISDFISKKLT